MIKCWKSLAFGVEDARMFSALKPDGDVYGKPAIEGYFLTADELTRIQREAFEAGRLHFDNPRKLGVEIEIPIDERWKFLEFEDYIKTKEPKL